MTLVIDKLVKEYQRGKPILKGIDLTIEGAGLTAIIGPSGTGKSTLIRCINRLVEPTSGEILFDGQDLARLDAAALRHARRHIGMVFQEYNLVERLTVMENLLSGRLGYVSAWTAWRRKFADADIQKAFALLQRVGLADYFHFALRAEDIGIAKPDARLFQEALQRGGVDASAAVHVGDHPGDDIAGAQQAGLRAVWFNPSAKVWEGDKRPDAEIRSLTELPKLLRKWQ